MKWDCMSSVHPPFPEKNWRGNDGTDKEETEMYLWGLHSCKMTCESGAKYIGALLHRNAGAQLICRSVSGGHDSKKCLNLPLYKLLHCSAYWMRFKNGVLMLIVRKKLRVTIAKSYSEVKNFLVLK